MIIQGNWYYQGSAAQTAATLHCRGEDFTLQTAAGARIHGKLADFTVSDRLGNIERKLSLEDGSVFATADNASIDRLFAKSNTFNGLIHRLESHMSSVLVALVLTLASGFSFVKWGIPWAATHIAHALPHKTNELIAAHSLEFLDKALFEPSQLRDDETSRIRQHFQQVLLPLEAKSQDINYRLHFRQWRHRQQGIANAFALPSGDLILTDALVTLSQNQDEIDAVLLHEMGHVVHRHSLQRVIESTLIATIIMLLVGDVNSIADIGLSVGSLLISGNYSREHESEADRYAFEKMLHANINPQAFADVLTRIAAHMDALIIDNAPRASDGEKNASEILMDYLSSHPNTEARVKQALRYQHCFTLGLTSCNP
ncbi:MAG: M48 family metallopeptidase [Cellvibrionaceae bacterium]|nr:M48 family metallopeptidase [Cellvibrionaceae bacterium]